MKVRQLQSPRLIKNLDYTDIPLYSSLGWALKSFQSTSKLTSSLIITHDIFIYRILFFRFFSLYSKSKRKDWNELTKPLRFAFQLLLSSMQKLFYCQQNIECMLFLLIDSTWVGFNAFESIDSMLSRSGILWISRFIFRKVEFQTIYHKYKLKMLLME